MAKKSLKSSTSTRALLAKNGGAVKKSAPAKKPAGKPALPGKYDEPLESYSPYAQHRILLEKFGTDEAGQAKVFKYGTETLGLPATQVKTYIREKLAAIQRDEMKALGVHPTKAQVEAARTKKSEDLDIEYKHPSREAAEKALASLAKRNHLRDRAFHIVKKDGKFAVVPAHILPVGQTPTFKKGDIVVDAFIDDSRATVIEPGPEVSTIRYDNERKYTPKEVAVSNRYLIKVEKPAKAEAKTPKQAAGIKAGVKKVAKKKAA